MGSDQKKKIVDISGGNGLPSKGGWPLPKRWGEKFSHPGGAQRSAAAPPHQKEPVEVVRA